MSSGPRRSWSGLQVSQTKITLFFVFLLLSITALVRADASGFSDLDDDCLTFNLGASCLPQPKKVKPVPKKVPPPILSNNEIILLYPAGNDVDANRVAKQYGLKIIEKAKLSSIKTGMLLASTGGKHPKQLSKIINFAEKNLEASENNSFSLSALSRRPVVTSSNYSMHETGVNSVHKTTKGKGTRVCMVDTPIDIYHTSFSTASIETIDFTKYTPDKSASLLHGTSVAGVIVSQNKYIGIAPKVQLLSIAAFSYSKNSPRRLQGTSADIAKAINSCIEYKADVINLSFTGGRDSLLEKVVKKAIEKGIIVVAAAGNGGHWGSTVYPALIPGVLAATATDKNRKLYSMADKGLFVDIAAPGVNVLTLAPGDKYELASGTSISSAHVTGVIALLLSQNNTVTISDALSSTAIDLGKPGRDQEFGDGLINASRALNVVKRGRARSSIANHKN